MCGRIVQKPGIARLAIVDGLEVNEAGYANFKPHWNGAPGQEHLVIRQNDKTQERTIEPLRWGLVPAWEKDLKKARKPINAKAETVASLPSFRSAYKHRRCILPVDGFFEWCVTEDVKQPYAIARRDGQPFGIAGIWENWKTPTDEWLRTFAIITVEANELVGRIHDRMPAILDPDDYEAWLNGQEGASELLRSFPADLMKVWPISTRVNFVRNDDEELLEEINQLN